jgi:hypothetical protein
VARKTSRKSSGRTTAKSPKKATSRKAKATKRSAELVTTIAEDEVSIDRRRTDRRHESSEASPPVSETAPLERRKKVNRRRQIDPTTCERDYTDQEVEFMNALDDYKRKSGRMFPTCSEVLEVLRGLGYIKVSASEMSTLTIEASAASAKPMPTDWSADENAEAAALATNA